MLVILILHFFNKFLQFSSQVDFLPTKIMISDNGVVDDGREERVDSKFYDEMMVHFFNFGFLFTLAVTCLFI